jgi:hypothetical protein
LFWQKKSLKYDILILPLKKPIEELSAVEAEKFYIWFMEQIPHRVAYLSKYCANQLGISQDNINLSPESLVFLWKWFLKIAETERTPAEGLKYLVNSNRDYPHAFRQYLLNQEKQQFSLQTEYILIDIGIYVGEVFVRENPTIRWGYYTEPKTDFFVNKPVLCGFVDTRFTPHFQTEFEPIHMVGVQAANIWDNTQKDTDLLDLYRKWIKYIPDSTE